jgi:MYXO-CTERM domain-containing protein
MSPNFASRTALVATFMAGLSSAPLAAQAQIGSGWNEYMPIRRVQTRGCATHGAAGGVDTFTLTCADTGGDNRAEARVENDYSSGTRQFEGEVRVVSLGGSNVSLKQTFMPDNGAFLMLGVASDGRLYSVGDAGADLATGIIGKWVRINTIHDHSTGNHEIYVDGVLKFTKTGGRQVAFHDKYGTYRLGSGRGPIVAEWRNIRYFRDGKSDGAGRPIPPTGDGGVADARSEDAATGEDAGPERDGSPAGTGGAGDGSGGATGGVTGSGGATGNNGGSGGSGSTATGGRGGSGGKGGAPGGGTPSPAAPSDSAGCGCKLGASGGSPGGDALAALLAAGALILHRRRSQRTARHACQRRFRTECGCRSRSAACRA